MVKEVLDYLTPQKGGVYVDCTLGTGGHSLAILEKMKGSIKLIGVDWDEKAIKISKERLRKYQDKISLIRANFAEIKKILKKQGIQKVNGFLYDLGLSSLQLSDFSRGFSFLEDAFLDMRMDKRKKVTAAHLVNTLNQDELEDILLNLGQESWAKRMAKFIIDERKASSLSTTKQLVDILKKAVPAKFRRGNRIHFATKAFQALRIAVNQELVNLEKSLSTTLDLLYPGGKICVISYHSLEDRIVKNKFKKVGGEELTILTKKVIRPSFEETKANPRSRSAKLRAAEKL